MIQHTFMLILSTTKSPYRLKFKGGLPDKAGPAEVSMVQEKIEFAFYLILGSVILVFALFPCSQ